MRRDRTRPSAGRPPHFMVLGVGAFAHSVCQALADAGARVCTYLTRNYGHFPPSLAGPTYNRELHPNPCTLIAKLGVDVVIPQSIDWAQAPWAEELRRSGAGILSPTGEAMLIERERDFARRLCAQFKIPYPRAYVAQNRLEAEAIVRRRPLPYVIKNPLCAPASPVHTILCQTVEETRAWLAHVNYAEGVFLQEYLEGPEAGHIVFVTGGEIYSVVTNQEYKRAFDGDLGIVAGAPLGGLVEADPTDKYGLARELIHPLWPWLRQSKFNGPLQVTAIKHRGKWHVIEYNIRIGITSGPMLLRMLANPVEVISRTAQNKKIELKFRPGLEFGCSITLAGYGYPFVQLRTPHLPLTITGPFDCDVWWNEVTRDADGNLIATGHRIADVVALGPTVEEAVAIAYRNIRKIRLVGSYYRTDIGRIRWPPGAM
ncbi:MAG: phosphoribosylamine--glycine ligase [Verrucomicrobiae bacterium]|nr:phosphoribosylamine--glycine ligase [Verrucomicrobiae bacterium]MCX7721607.1 phosphoribosylamine--glycine ligase [Verrucomicrobiae bacterium]MDW7979629.1 phosphoribosylglycinamide synthetase C domain-containing protein [Verrucomicrobiales bacterium]